VQEAKLKELDAHSTQCETDLRLLIHQKESISKVFNDAHLNYRSIQTQHQELVQNLSSKLNEIKSEFENLKKLKAQILSNFDKLCDINFDKVVSDLNDLSNSMREKETIIRNHTNKVNIINAEVMFVRYAV
jgi:chromosome segregation ATPase